MEEGGVDFVGVDLEVDLVTVRGSCEGERRETGKEREGEG